MPARPDGAALTFIRSPALNATPDIMPQGFHGGLQIMVDGDAQPFTIHLGHLPQEISSMIRASFQKVELPLMNHLVRECPDHLLFRLILQKHAGQPCEGVQLHVIDREQFRAVRTGLAVVEVARRLYGRHFDWRREAYEFVSDRLAFDLLAGTDQVRKALEAGASISTIEAGWAEPLRGFEERRRDVLLYQD